MKKYYLLLIWATFSFSQKENPLKKIVYYSIEEALQAKEMKGQTTATAERRIARHQHDAENHRPLAINQKAL